MGEAKRVLVVDDDETTRRLVALNLELEGYKVRAVGDGETCLRRAVEELPDVITLDVVLPGIDGYDTTRRLRADARTARIPVIMVTGAANEIDRRAAMDAGVDAFVAKPFEPDDLVAAVARLEGVFRGS